MNLTHYPATTTGNKPLSKAAKRASRQDLASMDAPGAGGGGGGSNGGGALTKSKKRGSRQHLAGMDGAQAAGGGGSSPTVGRGVKPQKLDMNGEEMPGGGAVVADAVVPTNSGSTKPRRSSRIGLPPVSTC